MKKSITVVDTNGKLQDLPLTLKDIFDLQTKESKRTFALGAGATAINIASMLMPKSPAKYITLGLGLISTVATVASNYDCANKINSEENEAHTKQILSEIAARHGITVDL